jgi:alcohol dehydrogenase class IV
MVVCDRVVHEVGVDDSLLTGLAQAGFDVNLFAEIAGEPDLEVVARAAESAAAIKAVAFIGIGGGSALDTAKLVAYRCASPTSLRDLRGPVPRVSGYGPLVLVPTTVGTGAEATRVSMFAVGGAKRAVISAQFVPDIAVLDPDLVVGLPASVVASTALDALSHAVESMLSTTTNELTWVFSAEAARRVFEFLPAAYAGDHRARGELLYASFLAGVSLNAGVVLGHSLSYVLAARHDLAHGVGCALALPYCLAYNQTIGAERGAALAEAVLGRTSHLRDLADTVRELTASVGLPTDMSGFTGTHESASQLAEATMRDYPRPTNPEPLEQERLTQLLTHLHAGDLSAAWLAMETV